MFFPQQSAMTPAVGTDLRVYVPLLQHIRTHVISQRSGITGLTLTSELPAQDVLL